MPAGTAIVADCSQPQVFERETMNILVNYWGDAEFATDTYIVRAETRTGIGVVRPRSFALCTLTSS